MKNEMEYRLNDNVIISDKINKMTREELEKAIKQKESEMPLQKTFMRLYCF